MDEAAGEASEQPEPVHALGSAPGVHVVGGQLPGGKDMQPVQLALDPASRLVGMGDLRLDQLFAATAALAPARRTKLARVPWLTAQPKRSEKISAQRA